MSATSFTSINCLITSLLLFWYSCMLVLKGTGLCCAVYTGVHFVPLIVNATREEIRAIVNATSFSFYCDAAAPLCCLLFSLIYIVLFYFHYLLRFYVIGWFSCCHCFYCFFFCTFIVYRYVNFILFNALWFIFLSFIHLFYLVFFYSCYFLSILFVILSLNSLIITIHVLHILLFYYF